MSPLSNIEIANRGEGVYKILRNNIVNLNLKPGSILKLKELAEKLSVSRTPIREALIRLEKEGLVKVIPQVGTRISLIDPIRVEEEKFIRLALEEKVIESLQENCIKDILPQLEEALERQKEYIEKDQPLSFLEWDDNFHKSLFYGINKKMSWELVKSNSGHYRRLRIIALWDQEIIKKALEEHTEIYHSLKENRIAKIKDMIHSHLSNITEQSKKLMSRFPDYFKTENSEENTLDIETIEL